MTEQLESGARNQVTLTELQAPPLWAAGAHRRELLLQLRRRRLLIITILTTITWEIRIATWLAGIFRKTSRKASGYRFCSSQQLVIISARTKQAHKIILNVF